MWRAPPSLSGAACPVGSRTSCCESSPSLSLHHPLVTILSICLSFSLSLLHPSDYISSFISISLYPPSTPFPVYCSFIHPFSLGASITHSLSTLASSQPLSLHSSLSSSYQSATWSLTYFLFLSSPTVPSSSLVFLFLFFHITFSLGTFPFSDLNGALSNCQCANQWVWMVCSELVSEYGWCAVQARGSALVWLVCSRLMTVY